MTNLPDLPLFARGFHLCGHRGDSITGHENSRKALTLAAEKGATMCEVDLRLTRDGKFAMFHDDVLGHMSSGEGFIGAYSLAELQAMRHRLRGSGTLTDEPLLSFAELLAHAKSLNLALIVEMKDKLSEGGHFAEMRRQIVEAGMADHVIISSFDYVELAALKAAEPELPTMGIMHGRHVDPLTLCQNAKVDVFSTDYPHYDPEQAKVLLAAGIRTAHFVPRPAILKEMGLKGEGVMAGLVDLKETGTLQILGSDDVQWMSDLCQVDA